MIVAVHQNDRPGVLVPPYESAAQQAEIGDMRSMAQQSLYGWHRQEAEEYFNAGGGTGFETEWEFVLSRQKKRLDALEAGTLARTGSQLHHLFVARKPR